MALASSEELKQSSPDKCDGIKLERNRLEKQLMSAERSLLFPFPQQFYSQLVDEFESSAMNITLNNGCKIHTPIEALFQSDTLICKAVLDGHCHLAVGNDTDFGFLCGKNILQVSGFKLVGRMRGTRTINDISIMTPSSMILLDIDDILGSNETCVFKEAIHPLLETIPQSHHIIRAMAAVSLGCDTNPDGISGIGPSAVYQMFKDVYKTIFYSEKLKGKNILAALGIESVGCPCTNYT